MAFTEIEDRSSGVNMLTNSFKISDTTEKEILELIFFQRDRETWQKYCRGDVSGVSDTLICWLSISVLRRGFLGF